MVQKLIYEKWKIPIKKRTKKGGPSTDKKTLEVLSRDYPKIKTILKFIDELRKMRKMKSTYLTGYKKLVDDNNRLHTTYYTIGTVTGRLSSRNPNLQNVPRDPIFRSLFIACINKTRKLVIADYSQIEARLIAFLAGELELIEKFKDPKFDIHIHNSYSVRKRKNPNLKETDITKEQRSHDKAITFGMNYGRSAYSIAEEYELDVDEVIEFIDDYFKAHPKIYQYRVRCVNKAREDKILRNSAGRVRHFDGYKWLDLDLSKEHEYPNDPKPREGSIWHQMEVYLSEHTNKKRRYKGIVGGMDRQAINYNIQSYASDILSRAIDRVRRKIRKLKLDAFMTMDVHDCQIADSSDEDSERTKRVVEEEMPITIPYTKRGYSMTFGAEVSIEDHWVQ
jgi:DNA polymerase-1